MAHSYEYPRPGLTVDCVLFGLDATSLSVLLIRRGVEPFAGQWALPGGFVLPDETIDEAARRELREETGVEDLFLEQLYTFGDPGRDPRGWTVSVAYYSLVSKDSFVPKADSDAAEAKWFDLDDISSLAFDHDRILESALTRVRGKIRYSPIAFEFVPESFTLTQLQQVFEIVLKERIDKRNFRRKIQRLRILEETGEYLRGGVQRPAKLFRFDRGSYEDRQKDGFELQL